MSLCSVISLAYSVISFPYQMRFYYFFMHVPNWQAHNLSPQSCSKYVLVREVHLFFQQFIVCFILSLRTYALYGRSRRLLGWMVIIGLILGGGAFAGSFGDDTSSATAALGNCYETYTAETAIRHGLAWLMIFVYELLIFVLTVFRICKTRALLRFSLLISRRNIIDIMFQDGAMYFAAMTMVNLANMLTYYCGPDIISGNLATFTSCISVTLISRLMLNLHKSIDTGIFSTTPTQDHDDSLAVLTTRVNVQSAISSHHW
ncbi:hypothetical protein DFH29DRAFT_511618 [Suillus ampliporus]|nr:hypothetical protein DFH29DRAFT_511618 [Suillus ampliporus]